MKWLVEEAEVHRPEQRLGTAAKVWPGISDHDQTGRQPGVVDRREEGTQRLAFVGPVPQTSAGPNVVPVEEEAVVTLQPGHRRERLVEAMTGLIGADDS